MHSHVHESLHKHEGASINTYRVNSYALCKRGTSLRSRHESPKMRELCTRMHTNHSLHMHMNHYARKGACTHIHMNHYIHMDMHSHAHESPYIRKLHPHVHNHIYIHEGCTQMYTIHSINMKEILKCTRIILYYDTREGSSHVRMNISTVTHSRPPKQNAKNATHMHMDICFTVTHADTRRSRATGMQTHARECFCCHPQTTMLLRVYA